MSETETRRRVLFLCTGNSCRSQMAEGLLRLLGGERYTSLSAGARPAGYVHPLAIEVMDELDVDLRHGRSKHIEEFLPGRGTPLDLVISVCEAAAEECPTFPGRVERKHWPFHDPVRAEGDDEERRAAFRRVRDEIRRRLEEALQAGELD